MKGYRWKTGKNNDLTQKDPKIYPQNIFRKQTQRLSLNAYSDVEFRYYVHY